MLTFGMPRTRPQRRGPWAWSSPPASVEWVPVTCSGPAVRPQLWQTFSWIEIDDLNLGTRRHALSIWCQEEPTFERRRCKESQVLFKATDHHWHVRPPTLPELGPLLFGQWNDIFLHTHVTLLHMNRLKDQSAQHFQHLKFKMCEDWWGIWKNGNLRIAEISFKKKRAIWQFVGEVPLWRLPGARGDRPTAAGHSGRQTPNSVLSRKVSSAPSLEFCWRKKIACYLKKTCKILIRSNAINVYSMSPVTSFPLVNSCRPAEFVAWKPQLQPAAELQRGQGLSKGAKRGRDIVMLYFFYIKTVQPPVIIQIF